MKEDKIQYAYRVLINPELMHSEEFRIWISYADNADLFWSLKAIFENQDLEAQKLPDVAEEWCRFCRSVNATNINTTENRKTFTHRVLQCSVAASLAILLAGGAFFLTHILTQDYKSEILVTTEFVQEEVHVSIPMNDVPSKIEYTTIWTSYGEDTTFVLSDGSRVMLNAGSSIRYPNEFLGSTRTVELTGEAYFEVEHDKSHPFIVKTRQLDTRVLGTSFIVSAYDYKPVQVTLVEGRVALQKIYASNLTYLNPGENAMLLSDGSISVKEVDTETYTAWTKGYFYFENSSLETIMRELGRWYNLNIQFADVETMDQHFDFWADRNKEVSKTLEILELLGKTRFVHNNNTITVYGVKED